MSDADLPTLHPWCGVLLAVLVLAGCSADTSDERARWLHHSLVLDNQPFLDREPELTAGKFALMSDSLYAYMRATATQFAQDVMLPGQPGRLPSRYLDAPARTVALMGDPHPENIGTFLTGSGELRLEYNDFDGATYGPYLYDVRRMAVGHWIFIVSVQEGLAEVGVSLEDPDTLAWRVVEEAARGYAQEMESIAAGEAGLVIEHDDDDPGRYGAIIEELFERTRARGRQNDRLLTYSVPDPSGGPRRLRVGDVERPREVEAGRHTQTIYEDSVAEVSPLEARLVAQWVQASLGTLEATDAREHPVHRGLGPITVHDVVRRLGGGVSSYPNLRYYALVSLPGDEAYVLLETKETLDATTLPGLERFPENPAVRNAERVVYLQRAMQSSRMSDPWLGWMASGGQSHRIRERSSYQRNHQHSRVVREIESERFGAQDLIEFGSWAGRLLARTHTQTPRQDGRPAAPAIAAAIGGDVDGFAYETAAFAESYVPTLLEDHQHLRSLVEREGFDLGYRRP